MLFILEHCQDVWCTKMNKLLFYIDFMSYRERGMAISGLSYRAIDYGPVPERWDRVYSEFSEIKQDLRQVGDYAGSILNSSEKADEGLFSIDELEIMNTVCKKFGSLSSRELSRLSHEENAWLKYNESHDKIPFAEAFSLKAI